MSDKGFIVINRKITEWKWWGNVYAMSIWLYILMSANWKDGHWAVTGESVKRGSFVTSLSRMADELGLDRRTIKHWLDVFKSDGQVDFVCTRQCTRITVIKYRFYQDHDIDHVQPDVQPDVHNRTKKQRNKGTIKPINNNTCSSDNERDSSSAKKKRELKGKQAEWFAEFWESYPRKVGKGQAEKAFTKACRSEVDFAAIMHGLSQQNEEKFRYMTGTDDERFIPYPSTWLNGKRWEDSAEKYSNGHNSSNNDLVF